MSIRSHANHAPVAGKVFRVTRVQVGHELDRTRRVEVADQMFRRRAVSSNGLHRGTQHVLMTCPPAVSQLHEAIGSNDNAAGASFRV